jgi:hypothetical protein
MTLKSQTQYIMLEKLHLFLTLHLITIKQCFLGEVMILLTQVAVDTVVSWITLTIVGTNIVATTAMHTRN